MNKAVYIAIGIRLDGMKEVMGMYIGGNESAKYWLGVLNDLKARGVQDILVCCVDGLSGFTMPLPPSTIGQISRGASYTRYAPPPVLSSQRT